MNKKHFLIFFIIVLFINARELNAMKKKYIGIHWLARNSMIIGVGSVLSAETGKDAGSRCAMISPELIVRGKLSSGPKKVCYGGKGPLLQQGEEAIFFASIEVGDELSLSHAGKGLITPSNILWTITRDKSQTPEYKFEQFRDALIKVVSFINANSTSRNDMALDFMFSDNRFLWEFLSGEINYALPYNHSEGEKPSLSFDPSILVPKLMEMIKEKDKDIKLMAFSNLFYINSIQLNGQAGRFDSECMDAALILMEDEDRDIRKNAYNYAKWNTDLIPEGKTGIDLAKEKYGKDFYSKSPQEQVRLSKSEEETLKNYDFGYDPDGLLEEREAALEKWKGWWKDNRCKGRYACGEEWEDKKKKKEEKKKKLRERREERDKQDAELYKERINSGEIKLDPSAKDGGTRIIMKLLKKAGYTVTSDGRVIDPTEQKSSSEKEDRVSGNAVTRFLGCTKSSIVGAEHSESINLSFIITIIGVIYLLLRRKKS